MKYLVRIIRILALVILIWSVLVLIALAGVKSQRDTLPKVFGSYMKLMDDSSMAPAAGKGALIVFREENPFEPGDIASYLNDENRVAIGRIKSIGGKVSGVSVTVPFAELKAQAENLSSAGAGSVMEDDPDVVLACDADGRETTIPADRLNGKEVFHSQLVGDLVGIYENTAAAAFITILSFLIALWPFGDRGQRKPKYSDRDINGPWIG